MSCPTATALATSIVAFFASFLYRSWSVERYFSQSCLQRCANPPPNDETGTLHRERVSCGFANRVDAQDNAFQLTDQIPLRSSMASSLAGRIEHMGWWVPDRCVRTRLPRRSWLHSASQSPGSQDDQQRRQPLKTPASVYIGWLSIPYNVISHRPRT